MELRTDREHAVSSLRVLDTEITQAAEHDFILPDYCPDIFRVLKCSIVPGVTSIGINGSRLTFDLCVTIRVLYRSPEGTGVCCVEHTQEYTRTADLPPDAVSPSADITPAVSQVNCRVVDKRRLEVRGNISCHVTADAENSVQLLKNACGCGIQLKKAQTVFPSERLVSTKRVTVIEELELAQGKPPFGSVIQSRVDIVKGEQRIIPGKLVTKGEARVSMLYLSKDSSSGIPETMRFSIPFSQVMDISRLEDDFDCDVKISAAKCVITPRADSALLECELVMLVRVTAFRYSNAELVTDAYSTRYETTLERLKAVRLSPPDRVNVPCIVVSAVTCPEGELVQVYDMWCEQLSAFIKPDDDRNGAVLYGKLSFCMLGKLSDGTVVYSEKESAFETQLPDGHENFCKGLPDTAEISVRMNSCSYTLNDGTEDGGSISAKAELELSAVLFADNTEGLVTDITADTEHPKCTDGRCAVRICYTDSGESLWETAKRYSTEADALAEENPPCGDSDRQVLIIPIKN